MLNFTLCCILCTILKLIIVHANSTHFQQQNEELAVFNKNKEICMKELGCFSIPSEFKHPLYRPINVLPQDRMTIGTRFLLYTRRNSKEPDVLKAHDVTTFTGSHMDQEKPIILIVHGFMDNELFGPWMVRMKDEFLLKNDYNVVIVDWSGGNKIPYYQATSNTRVVGAEIALLISALSKFFSIKPENVHIIGHSLGAHIAGYAGAKLKNLGRITGCDPAEPYFQNMPPSIRLDPGDANYVDVIHSDATTILLMGFGMSQLVGHVDFFPNDGRKQPGCAKSKMMTFVLDGLNEGTRRFVSCNHQRALDFMHHSINYKNVVPVGYECSNWETFLQGKCAECGTDVSKCAIMGIRADEYKHLTKNKTNRIFYLKTSEKSPFWLYHYQVSIKLSKPRFAHQDQKGTIDIILHGSKEDYLAHVQNKATELYHGSRYQYLVTTDKDLGTIRGVNLKWFSKSINPIKLIKKPRLYVEYITVIPMNVIEKSPRNLVDRVFCSNSERAIPPKEIAAFVQDKACMGRL